MIAFQCTLCNMALINLNTKQFKATNMLSYSHSFNMICADAATPFTLMIFRQVIQFLQKNLNSSLFEFEELLTFNFSKFIEQMINKCVSGKACANIWLEEYLKKALSQIEGIIQSLTNHPLNLKLLTFEEVDFLINNYLNLQEIKAIEEQLMLCIQLSAFGTSFQTLGSNAAYISNQLNLSFRNKNLKGVKLRSIDLTNANFVNANLSHSKFDRVNISGCDFSAANLYGTEWSEIQSPEISELHKGKAFQLIKLSPDGETLALTSFNNVGSLYISQLGRIGSQLFQINQEMDLQRILQVAFSNDGRQIALATVNGSIRVYSLRSGKCVKIRVPFVGQADQVEFSQNSQHILVANRSGSIYLIDMKTLKQIRVLRRKQFNQVHPLAISPNGLYFISGCYSSQVGTKSKEVIQLISLATWNKIQMWHGHLKSVRLVRYFQNSQNFVSASVDSTIRVWSHKQQNELLQFQDESLGVCCLHLIYDDKYLVTGGYDNTINLWDLWSKRRLKKFDVRIGVGHPVSFAYSKEKSVLIYAADSIHLLDLGPVIQSTSKEGRRNTAVYSLSVSPDNKHFASAGEDMTVRLWRLQTGREIWSTQKHKKLVNSVAFSFDGTQLASGSSDASIILWDWEKGSVLQILESNTIGVNAVIFSPDGKFLASANDDQTICLWKIKSAELVKSFKKHQKLVKAISFSKDGKYLVSGSEDKTLRVWNVETGLKHSKHIGHFGRVLSVAFSPTNSEEFTSSGDDHLILLWQLSNKEYAKKLEGHKDAVQSIVYSANGGEIISASNDGTVRVWDLTIGVSILKIEHPSTNKLYRILFAATLSTDEKRLLSASLDGSIAIWKVKRRGLVRVLDHQLSYVKQIALSRNCKIAVTGASDRVIRIWDLHSGRQTNFYRGHKNAISGLSITSDWAYMASACLEQSIRIWDMKSGMECKRLCWQQARIETVAFSPCDVFLASGCIDGTFVVWEVHSEKQKIVKLAHTSAIRSLCYLPEGSGLITAGGKDQIKLWDPSSGHLLKQFEGHNDLVNQIDISSDGKYLGSASNDLGVLIWEIHSGQQHLKLEEAQRVISIAFSKNAILLASGNTEGLVKIWKLSSGVLLRTLFGHTDIVCMITFSNDGNLLATGSNDGTARFWGLEEEVLQDDSKQDENQNTPSKFLPVLPTKWNSDSTYGDEIFNDCFAGIERETSGEIISMKPAPDVGILALKQLNQIEIWELSTGLKLHQWKSQEAQNLYEKSDSERLFNVKNTEIKKTEKSQRKEIASNLQSNSYLSIECEQLRYLKFEKPLTLEKVSNKQTQIIHQSGFRMQF